MTKRHFELFAESFRVRRVTTLNRLKAVDSTDRAEVARLNGMLVQLSDSIDDFCTISQKFNPRFDSDKFKAATHSDKFPQDKTQ